ncbi:unnamed protein product [Lathyrus sativus]|nr:unnamed protein product [Lathyrus sativus]
MLIICEKLAEAGIIQEVHGFYEACLSSPEECKELKRCLKELINQGMVQISRTKNEESISTLEPLEIPYLKQDAQESPLVICFPTPFPFDSTKAVPWNYGATGYVGDNPLVLEHNVTNIAGIGGVTRSGRVFAPEQTQRKVPEKSKGKEVSSSISDNGPSNKTIPQEGDDEFLKIIKKSDYKVVDQLGKEEEEKEKEDIESLSGEDVEHSPDT